MIDGRSIHLDAGRAGQTYPHNPHRGIMPHTFCTRPQVLQEQNDQYLRRIQELEREHKMIAPLMSELIATLQKHGLTTTLKVVPPRPVRPRLYLAPTPRPLPLFAFH